MLLFDPVLVTVSVGVTDALGEKRDRVSDIEGVSDSVEVEVEEAVSECDTVADGEFESVSDRVEVGVHEVVRECDTVADDELDGVSEGEVDGVSGGVTVSEGELDRVSGGVTVNVRVGVGGGEMVMVFVDVVLRLLRNWQMY